MSQNVSVCSFPIFGIFDIHSITPFMCTLSIFDIFDIALIFCAVFNAFNAMYLNTSNIKQCALTHIIGGSRGREGRTPPPGHPNSFDFMQFSGKFGVFTPPLEGSRPPLGKILDPPLHIDMRPLMYTQQIR